PVGGDGDPVLALSAVVAQIVKSGPVGGGELGGLGGVLPAARGPGEYVHCALAGVAVHRGGGSGHDGVRTGKDGHRKSEEVAGAAGGSPGPGVGGPGAPGAAAGSTGRAPRSPSEAGTRLPRASVAASPR